MNLRIRHARTFAERARGLLGSHDLKPDQALLMTPCNSVHTFGMRYAIDVVFFDHTGKVLRICAQLAPWRIRLCPGAAATLELASGAAARQGFVVGLVSPVLAQALRSR